MYFVYSANYKNNPFYYNKNTIIYEYTIKKLESKNKSIDFVNLADKASEYVLRYVTLPLDYKYGSNSIPLAVATLLTTGDILELGMGTFSTPLLHNIGVDLNRQVVSIDTDLNWLNKFIFYNNTSTHTIYNMAGNEMNQFGLNKNWGLVLVDHIDQNARSLNVLNFSKLSKIVVVHDTEKSSESFYGYEKNKIRDAFKYACKYSIYSDINRSSYISTLILSNFINLDNLALIFNQIKTDYGFVACDINY